MKGSLAALAGLLGFMLIASDAFGANMWRTNGGHDGGGASSAGSFVTSSSTSSSSDGSYTGPVSVPEPSSLYAIGSALALVGAAGWMLRRK